MCITKSTYARIPQERSQRDIGMCAVCKRTVIHRWLYWYGLSGSNESFREKNTKTCAVLKDTKLRSPHESLMVLDDPANAFFRPVRIPAQPQIFIDENNVQFGPQGLAFYDGKYIAGSIRRAAVPALTGPGARDVGFIFLVITTFQKSVVGRNGLPDSFFQDDTGVLYRILIVFFVN